MAKTKTTKSKKTSAPVKVKDQASALQFGQNPTLVPDGEPARIYDNRGSGLSKVSGKSYNQAHGRAAGAPTVGSGHQGR